MGSNYNLKKHPGPEAWRVYSGNTIYTGDMVAVDYSHSNALVQADDTAVAAGKFVGVASGDNPMPGGVGFDTVAGSIVVETEGVFNFLTTNGETYTDGLFVICAGPQTVQLGTAASTDATHICGEVFLHGPNDPTSIVGTGSNYVPIRIIVGRPVINPWAAAAAKVPARS